MPIEFARSARSTVGIEWEVAIVDRATGSSPRSATGARGARERSGARHPFITSELLTNTVELVSGVHTASRGRRRPRGPGRRGARGDRRARRVRAHLQGSHPYSQWYDQRLTDKPRYHKLIERTRWWGAA